MSVQYDPLDHDPRRELLRSFAYRCCTPSVDLDNVITNSAIIDLADGEMGSFFLQYEKNGRSERVAGSAEYVDDDGVLVHISLYVNLSGLPTEIEIWKTNFEPTISYPIPNRLASIVCRD